MYYSLCGKLEKFYNIGNFVVLDLLKMIESEPDMPNTLQLKLNIMLSLLNKYLNNKKDINNSLFKLFDNSYVNILEAQKLSKQIDNIKANTQ